MGTLVGHVAPGFAFFVLGLWHLYNNIKLFCLHPNTFNSSPWFPTSKFRHLELYLIMLSSSASIAMELFIGPKKHQPFDSDGTIPSNHLHNFEHSSISMSFLVYAVFALVLDQARPKAVSKELTILAAASAFAQQLLLFHHHSADHMGIEGQYHKLLQLVIFVSLLTTLMVMGYMLWTPSLISKGCFLHEEKGHQVVRCSSDLALHRAKSLVNIEFSWFFVGNTIFVMSLYLILDGVYGENIEYSSLTTKDQVEEDGEKQEDIESLKMSNPGFVQMGKIFGDRDVER
ncbi:BnaA05g13890D [Brassica napus]|uniref:BnaA05g13890D protein n=1 Tax=Brassica napus TaxID=3708 RepID=A0A078F176_BRANA|nr:BnaA05g13890D [Brassica napus]